MTSPPRRSLSPRRGQSAIEWVLIISLVVVILFLGAFLMRRQLVKAAVAVGEAIGIWSKEEEPPPATPGATPGAKGAKTGEGAKSPESSAGGAKGATGSRIDTGKTALDIQKSGGSEAEAKAKKKKEEEELEFQRRQRESGPAGRPGGGRRAGTGDGGLFGLSLGKQIFVLGAGLGVLFGAAIFLRMLRRR